MVKRLHQVCSTCTHRHHHPGKAIAKGNTQKVMASNNVATWDAAFEFGVTLFKNKSGEGFGVKHLNLKVYQVWHDGGDDDDRMSMPARLTIK